jgi:hypothetical protein
MKTAPVQVDVDIMVKERPMKSADIEAEWQIAPGASGKPAVANIVPGGSLTFEHRNIARKGRQVKLALMTLMAIHMAGEACSIYPSGKFSCKRIGMAKHVTQLH